MLKDILVAALLLRMVSSQCILQNHLPRTPIEIATARILEAFTGRQTPQIPVPSTPSENIVLCKNLAAQIESRALAKLRRNAVKRPVFGQIIGPLLDEIALVCQCPVCQNSHQNAVVLPNTSAAMNNLFYIVSTPNYNLNQFPLSYY